MIEKLDVKYIPVESDSNAKLELANKINEIVDAVNVLQCKNVHIESDLQDLMYPKEIKCETPSEAECVRLQNELERTRKALDVAVNTLTRIAVSPETMMEPEKVVPQLANLALEQITALEQKD